jgi:hypothetical protein
MATTFIIAVGKGLAQQAVSKPAGSRSVTRGTYRAARVSKRSFRTTHLQLT